MLTSYEVICDCDNCGWEGKMTVKKNIAVRSIMCPKCGCVELRRMNEFYNKTSRHFVKCTEVNCWCQDR